MMNTITKDNEFVPFDYFVRLSRLWWVVVLCAVLGGAIGLIIHRMKPPLYEAQAILTANIDFNKINFLRPTPGTAVPYQFTQYDEDLSLAKVQTALFQVIPQVVAFGQQIGVPLDATSLQEQSTIERKNAFWEVHYRNVDPVAAQKIANYWAQQGLADLKNKRSAGQLEPYITFDLVRLAELPTSPSYYQTNGFVFAGGMLGLIAGMLLINLPFFGKRKNG